MSEKGRSPIADEPPWRVSDFLLRWETILFGLLVLVFLGDTFLSPYFLDIDNLSDATSNFSEKAIIALGMALLILVREIDLSVAAIIALCSLAMGLASQAGAGPIPLVLIGLIIGAVCGSFNGILVARIGLPSIVVTIGTRLSTDSARIFPSSDCGPFFVGVLINNCTCPFFIKSSIFGRPSDNFAIRFALIPPFVSASKVPPVAMI